MGILDTLDKKFNPLRPVSDAVAGTPEDGNPKSVWVGEPVKTAPINPGQAAEQEARSVGQAAQAEAEKRGRGE